LLIRFPFLYFNGSTIRTTELRIAIPVTRTKVGVGSHSFHSFKHLRRIRLPSLIAAVVIASMPLAQAKQQTSPHGAAVGAQVLMARVGPPSRAAVDEFKKAGMESVRPHTLTANERAKIEAVLDSLPTLNRNVLGNKLHALAFVDGIPGEGTGLTSPVAKTGLYDITLRASILDEPLSTFLTTKERRLFIDDGSGVSVTVSGTGIDALAYVLLHESSHVMDFACGVTTESNSRFVAGVWANGKELVPELASSPVAATYFRGARRLGVGQAQNLYDSLARSPFVSLYATASQREDFAELVAWHEILKQHHGSLVIEVNDARGNVLGHWEPLTFPGLQKRFLYVDELLASPASCSARESRPVDG